MKYPIPILLVLLFIHTSCKEKPPAFIAQNKKVVHRLIDEVFTQGRLSIIDEIFADDVLMHDATASKPKRGTQNYRQVVMAFREAFPDAKYYIDDLVAENDRVAARWRLEGHHEGMFMGKSPSGNEIKVSGIIIFRFEERKIVEYWGVFNTLSLMKQIGVIEE